MAQTTHTKEVPMVVLPLRWIDQKVLAVTFRFVDSDSFCGKSKFNSQLLFARTTTILVSVKISFV